MIGIDPAGRCWIRQVEWMMADKGIVGNSLSDNKARTNDRDPMRTNIRGFTMRTLRPVERRETRSLRRETRLNVYRHSEKVYVLLVDISSGPWMARILEVE